MLFVKVRISSKIFKVDGHSEWFSFPHYITQFYVVKARLS